MNWPKVHHVYETESCLNVTTIIGELMQYRLHIEDKSNSI